MQKLAILNLLDTRLSLLGVLESLALSLLHQVDTDLDLSAPLLLLELYPPLLLLLLTGLLAFGLALHLLEVLAVQGLVLLVEFEHLLDDLLVLLAGELRGGLRRRDLGVAVGAELDVEVAELLGKLLLLQR